MAPFPWQCADQREKTTSLAVIDRDLALATLPENPASLIVQAAATHVYGLDLRRRSRANGLVVALANCEVVLDDPAERRQREHVDGGPRSLAASFARDLENQSVLHQPQVQRE